MAYAPQDRPPRPSQQTYTSPNGLRVITYVGDITTITDADAIVTGEDKKFENESFITKTLLQISPLEFAEKRQALKRKSGSFKSWTVHKSILMPPTQFTFVFHAMMKQVDQKKWVKNMKKMYKKLFEKAEKHKVQSLVLPLLGSGRANASTADAVQAVVESIAGFRNNRTLRTVYLVTLNKDIADSMASQCQYNFAPMHELKRTRSLRRSFGKFFSGSKKTKRDKTAHGRTSEHDQGRPEPTLSNTFPRMSRHEHRDDEGGFTSENHRRSRPALTMHSYIPAHGRRSEGQILMYKGHNNDRHSLPRDQPGGCHKDVNVKSHISQSHPHTHTQAETAVIEYSPKTAMLDTSRSASERNMGRRDNYQTKDVNGSTAAGYSKDRNVGKEEKFKKTAVINDVVATIQKSGQTSVRNEVEATIQKSGQTSVRNEVEATIQKGGQTGVRNAEGGLVNQTKNEHTGKKDGAVNMLDLSVSRNCPICISPITDAKWLDKCGHVFCRDCIDNSFKQFKPVCPSCNMVYGVLTGNQPDGNMDVGFSGDHLPGYEGHGTITITYYFPSGIQKEEHPNPGQQYKGTTRRAYLPDCGEGREILRLLKTAFDRKLTFTIGRSTTTGQENVVTWNDIHHKTQMDGGPTRFGYPDPGYLTRVKDELADKGVKDEATTVTEHGKTETTF